MEIKKVFAKDVKEGYIAQIEVAHCVFSKVKIENIENDGIQIFFSFYNNGKYQEVGYFPNSILNVYNI